ncbi:hypothetical protein FQN54_000767 [Arachnomyces sp. PD_36]|nr:hypothetical protein FQN54_000767 [Arachnomyces sp. PD_36]
MFHTSPRFRFLGEWTCQQPPRMETPQLVPPSRPSPLLLLPREIKYQIVDYLGPRAILSLLDSRFITVNDLATSHLLSEEEEDESTLLHAVSARERNEWTDAIIARYPNVSLRMACGETPLHLAVKMGHEKTAQKLIDAGAELSVAAPYHSDYTPLLWAIHRLNKKMIRMLLRNGADISQGDDEGWQPIHWATRYGYQGTVQLLLSYGADVSAQSRWGVTPLHIAASYGRTRVAQKLLDHGADQYIMAHTAGREEPYEAPLCAAVGEGKASMVRVLLHSGFLQDTVALDMIGFPLLHLAATGGFFGLIYANQKIRSSVADDAQTEGYLTKNKINVAAYDEVLEMLIQPGMDVSRQFPAENLTDPSYAGSVTPLHYAAFWGREKAVKLLLDAGADKSLETESGKTAIVLARANKHYGVCELLGES